MAQRTFNGRTLGNRQVPLTAPANGTVQNLINSAVRQTWRDFDLQALYHKGRRLQANTKLANISDLHNGDKIALFPKMGRMGINPNNMRAAKATLEKFFSQPRGGTRRKSKKSRKASRKARQTRRR